ncbi:hypothetical protein RO575_08340 [Methylomonas sp. MO1]|uniref:hypothetical protein n=1 Tax=Methylomonas sp. MO1 TaxID=3073619 RepID=UPI0028A505E9|nr:hypothetical protein [Methylomonas sp. MO1]MDT4289565.1 hypothetical protein [Methylomonas sp. MO1]
MNTHFTYTDAPDKSSLKQGDILAKTPGLISLIDTIHPHYSANEYTHFQILTQSCDLVRRNGSDCKSRYITLAAVRSLDLVINRYISEIKSDAPIKIDEKLFCSSKNKYLLEDKLKKIYNNNDKELFFLKKMPQLGLPEDSCTFLLLSIAIRAYEHYDLCLDAKILELKDNFQSKLGWLVGNLYSRVGTEDYVPAGAPDKATFEQMINEVLQEHIGWIPENIYKEFKSTAKTLDYKDFDEIITKATENKDKKCKTKLDAIISKIAKAASLDDDAKEKVRNSLAADPTIQKVINT